MKYLTENLCYVIYTIYEEGKKWAPLKCKMTILFNIALQIQLLKKKELYGFYTSQTCVWGWQRDVYIYLFIKKLGFTQYNIKAK